ncbi:ScbA/BarX family gamma-butyrolactone biosynthesis protein [Streptomyces sp. NPDC101151]|uniref:ScbA/BarX family gamma-butyrolactone biosynthesis protein n=1 Tax=Streptomyces sp. NPDC101151 TaxID=3366115 RepID=UPI003805869C
MSSTAQTARTVGIVPTRQALQAVQSYVHKSAASEVLVTGWRPEGEDAYVVTARWPQDHRFYRPVQGCYDPLLAAESIRQAVLLLGHAAYGVPLGNPQSWSQFRYSIEPLASTGSAAAEVELHVTCSGLVRRAGRLAAMTVRVDILREGVRVGAGEVDYVGHTPAVYRRVRGSYADPEAAMARVVPLAPPMPPARVARDRFEDVVLSPTDAPGRTQLRLDLNHPTLFDHRVDHVPGMLLLEAARQAAHTMSYPQPVLPAAMDAAFYRYIEFDEPCWVHAHPLPDDGRGRSRILVFALQHQTCAFSSITTLVPVPER